MADGKKIALGLCSSISIYKGCEIIRLLQKQGVEVQAVMTRNATRLISPRLIAALTGDRVYVDPYEEPPSERIDHVAMAKDLRCLLIAPATANMIGKLASGVADDFLSTLYLVVRCPVLVAPAMNENMYLHRRTQDNIRNLKAAGIKFVEPEEGYLACKDLGVGRLAPPEVIVGRVLDLMKTSRSLEGRTVCVTAGPTKEPLDPVRFLSNRSTGRMGFEMAEAAARRGARVILIAGPTHLPPPGGLEFRRVESAENMYRAVWDVYDQADIFVLAAAVSDLTFPEASPQKIKKVSVGDSLSIAKTKDILKSLGENKKDKFLVGFAAETEDVEANAREKLKAKNCDLIVANNVSDPGIGFASDHNRISLYSAEGLLGRTQTAGKAEIAGYIWDIIEERLGKKA
jgi:phosphopantothenoylcysteine decarboxylase/phosphopantothenate--cysteine ligase